MRSLKQAESKEAPANTLCFLSLIKEINTIIGGPYIRGDTMIKERSYAYVARNSIQEIFWIEVILNMHLFRLLLIVMMNIESYIPITIYW